MIQGFASGFFCVIAGYLITMPVRFLYRLINKS